MTTTDTAHHEVLLHRARVPKRYWSVKVKSNTHERKQVRLYVRHLGVELSKGRGLFLLGSDSKIMNTYMAVVIHAAVRRRLLSYWVTSTDLRNAALNRGRVQLDENWTVDEFAREVHVLGIADLGEEHRDDNWLSQFRNLIRTRSHAQKITVLAIEINADHLSKHYNASFAQFINDNFLIASVG